MRILITLPSGYNFKTGKLIKKKDKKGFSPHFVLPYLASFMPQKSQIDIIDEEIEDIDFNKRYDLVCITVKTPFAARAYEISQRFRDRNIPVVMGGYHINLMPEEAKNFANAIVIGEIECVWKEFLEDFNRGHIRKIYKAEGRFDMKSVPIPRYDLINWSKYEFFNTVKVPIATSRGCPHSCSYCCAPTVYGGVRYRPIPEVIEEIKILKKEFKYKFRKFPFFVFVDDDLTSNLDRAFELFEALIPLKIKWCGYFTSVAASKKELMRLAAKAGCFSIFIGFESINYSSLKRANKEFNFVSRYIKCIRNCRDNKILLIIGIMCGFPEDDTYTFYKTVEFLMKHKVPVIFLSVVYPFPNTPLYKMLKEENLLLEDRFWLKKPHNPFLLVKNENLIKEETNLEAIYKVTVDRLMKWKYILKRCLSNRGTIILSLVYNLYLRKIYYNKEGGFC